MRKIAVSTMLTNLVSMVGVDSFLTAETTAAVRSFNRFGKLAWDRTAWPFNSVISQVIPDLRVRSVQVGSGGASYTSAPTVAFSGGGGNSAAATATINADGEVNGVAVTNNGTAFTGVPTVHSSVAKMVRISECEYCVLPSRNEGVISLSNLTNVLEPSSE